jgi:hypothetical protein
MGKFATAQSLELRKSAIWRRCPRRKSPELDPKEQFSGTSRNLLNYPLSV